MPDPRRIDVDITDEGMLLGLQEVMKLLAAAPDVYGEELARILKHAGELPASEALTTFGNLIYAFSFVQMMLMELLLIELNQRVDEDAGERKISALDVMHIVQGNVEKRVREMRGEG